MAISGGDGSIVLTTKVDESGLKNGLSSIKSGIGTLTKAIAGIGVAMIGATAAVVKGAKDTAAYGDRVDKLSQKIGMSNESFQQWDYIMQINGASIETLQAGMKTLSSAAENGSAAFDKLGISQEEVKNSSPEQLFETTISKLQEMGEGTERTAIASQLLGRSATELGPLLNQNAESIDELKQRAIDYGFVMSDEAVAASAAFTDSLTTLSMTTTGLKNKLMAEFLPSLTSVTDGLALLMTGDMSGLDKINEGITEFVNQIADALPKIIEIGGSIIKTLADAIIANIPSLINTGLQIIMDLANYILNSLPQLIETALQVILTLAQGIIEALPELIPKAMEIILTISETLLDHLDEIIFAAIDIIVALAIGLIDAIPELLEKLPEIITSIVMFLTDPSMLFKLIEAAILLMAALTEGLIKSIPAILIGLAKIPPKMIEKLKENFNNFKEIGRHLIDGLWQGILNTKNWLLNKIKSFAKTITDGIKSFFGIHSPSTVMRDEVGKQIPAGMAIGIDKAKNLVTKATKSLVTDTRSEVQKVLDDMNEEMLDSEKLYAAESIRLKDSTVEADKEYLDNLKKTAETERKLYNARQKDIENLKRNIVDAYSEMANEALSSIEDLEKEQQNLEKKLAEYGGLMVEKTKKVRGKEVTYNALADLDEQKETLQRYYDMLQTVKERGNVPKEFFNVLRGLNIDEGLEYANALLELSDEDFAEYIKDWEEKQKLSQNISKALYEDEAQQLATEISDKFDEVEKEFFGVGENSADEFENGFMEQLQTVTKNIKKTIGRAFSGITPNYGIGGYSINVPALARGAVLPPNREFLAVVGDQKSGTNIEAPLATIEQAVENVLNRGNYNQTVKEEHYYLSETEVMTILYKLAKGGERLQGPSLITQRG